MTVAIAVNGTDYDVPSSAADTNWAADQVAFEQAVAAYLNSVGTAGAAATAAILVLQGNRVQVLSKNITPVGTLADTTEDNLMTYSLPAGTLSANGKGIRVTAWGDGVNTANITTVRGYFGATAVIDVRLQGGQANTWRAVFEVLRTGAATQTASCSFDNGGASPGVSDQANSAPTETLSGAVTVKMTGQRATSSVADSIRQLGMVVELLP